MSARTWLRLAGAAALGYVAGVGIENMDVLGAPTFGSPIAEIRASYADQALGVVTSVAGTLALGFYAVFVVGLYIWLREREAPSEPWAMIGLVGGITGPVVAAAGETAHGVVVAHAGRGLSDDVVRALFEIDRSSHMVAGVFVALALGGSGIAALRSRALPRWLAWIAVALAVPLAFASIAAFTGDDALEVIVTLLFAGQTAWIFLMGMWMTLADGVAFVTVARRAAFLTLVLAAGLVGLALLCVPASTGHFFSWGLSPAPLAAFSGGVYVASATVYALALPLPWPVVRGLVVGAVVLSVSVLTVTLVHLDIFDFDRLQAWAWLVLFIGFALITIGLLLFSSDEGGPRSAAPIAPWARVAFGAVAVVLAVLAVALWSDPTGVGKAAPFDLPPLGGRFAGCWIALLATLSGWAAYRNRRDEARLSALALVALPAGALAAAVRSIGDLEPAGEAGGYMALLAALSAAGLIVLVRGSALR